MSTRRVFIKQAAVAGAFMATATPIAGSARRNDSSAIAPNRLAAAAHRTIPRIKAAIRRDETIIRLPGDGDNWHMSWASDDRQYVSLCDGAGHQDHPRVSFNSRMLAISGGPEEAKFHDLPGYPMLAAPTQRPRDTRYYNFGTLAMDGFLYQFMSTFNRPFRADEVENPDLNNPVRFNGVKLIYSPDNGITWHNQNGSTPVVWESWDRRSHDTLVFFDEDQEAFSLLTILQMGKNYDQNRDGYVYLYAPNGNAEGSMNELVMLRVPKREILKRSRYEYFCGIGSGGHPKWSKEIRDRKPVHTFPKGWVNTLVHPYAWHPSVVYNSPLGIYLMANWGMGTGSDGKTGEKADQMWFQRPSYLGIWIAPDPWGPWIQVHEETAWLPGGDRNARAYQPQIAPKWISPDGKSLWLVWTDFQVTDASAMAKLENDHKRNIRANGYSESDVMRIVAMRRKHMPYYAFNMQRVDLVTT